MEEKILENDRKLQKARKVETKVAKSEKSDSERIAEELDNRDFLNRSMGESVLENDRKMQKAKELDKIVEKSERSDAEKIADELKRSDIKKNRDFLNRSMEEKILENDRKLQMARKVETQVEKSEKSDSLRIAEELNNRDFLNRSMEESILENDRKMQKAKGLKQIVEKSERSDTEIIANELKSSEIKKNRDLLNRSLEERILENDRKLQKAKKIERNVEKSQIIVEIEEVSKEDKRQPIEATKPSIKIVEEIMKVDKRVAVESNSTKSDSELIDEALTISQNKNKDDDVKKLLTEKVLDEDRKRKEKAERELEASKNESEIRLTADMMNADEAIVTMEIKRAAEEKHVEQEKKRIIELAIQESKRAQDIETERIVQEKLSDQIRAAEEKALLDTSMIEEEMKKREETQLLEEGKEVLRQKALEADQCENHDEERKLPTEDTLEDMIENKSQESEILSNELENKLVTGYERTDDELLAAEIQRAAEDERIKQEKNEMEERAIRESKLAQDNELRKLNDEKEVEKLHADREKALLDTSLIEEEMKKAEEKQLCDSQKEELIRNALEADKLLNRNSIIEEEKSDEFEKTATRVETENKPITCSNEIEEAVIQDENLVMETRTETRISKSDAELVEEALCSAQNISEEEETKRLLTEKVLEEDRNRKKKEIEESEICKKEAEIKLADEREKEDKKKLEAEIERVAEELRLKQENKDIEENAINESIRAQEAEAVRLADEKQADKNRIAEQKLLLDTSMIEEEIKRAEQQQLIEAENEILRQKVLEADSLLKKPVFTQDIEPSSVESEDIYDETPTDICKKSEVCAEHTTIMDADAQISEKTQCVDVQNEGELIRIEEARKLEEANEDDKCIQLDGILIEENAIADFRRLQKAENEKFINVEEEEESLRISNEISERDALIIEAALRKSQFEESESIKKKILTEQAIEEDRIQRENQSNDYSMEKVENKNIDESIQSDLFDDFEKAISDKFEENARKESGKKVTFETEPEMCVEVQEPVLQATQLQAIVISKLDDDALIIQKMEEAERQRIEAVEMKAEEDRVLNADKERRAKEEQLRQIEKSRETDRLAVEQRLRDEEQVRIAEEMKKMAETKKVLERKILEEVRKTKEKEEKRMAAEKKMDDERKAIEKMRNDELLIAEEIRKAAEKKKRDYENKLLEEKALAEDKKNLPPKALPQEKEVSSVSCTRREQKPLRKEPKKQPRQHLQEQQQQQQRQQVEEDGPSSDDAELWEQYVVCPYPPNNTLSIRIPITQISLWMV